MKSALFIGRFQPFHKGHLEVIKEILKELSIDPKQYEPKKTHQKMSFPFRGCEFR